MNTSAVKLLSHDDFKKVLQWTLIQSVEGTYNEQVQREKEALEVAKAEKGFLLPCHYQTLNELRKVWSRPALNAKSICVDITTGEVYEPSDIL